MSVSSQIEANERYQQTCVLVLTNVTAGLNVGLGWSSFQLKNDERRLCGFKFVPIGFNLCHYSVGGNTPLVDHFTFMADPAVPSVWRWNEQTELFEEEEERPRDPRQIDELLLPCDRHVVDEWCRLTAHVKRGKVDLADVPPRKSADRSEQLDQLLLATNSGSNGDGESFLEQFEFSFVVFCLGQDEQALNHWKALLALACQSPNSLEKHDKFFSRFLTVLNAQLQREGESLMSVEDDFVSHHVACLLEDIDECPSLRKYTQLPGWPAVDINAEDQPVVVQL